MPHAQIKVNQERLSDGELGVFGCDKVQFLFAPNKGSSFKELKKIASGGELSRLMLCIKSLIAKSAALPTLIFDEIDIGVSGEIAHKVGDILKSLAQSHQVLSITHLPQIASKGEFHYYVYKEVVGKRTITKVKQLDPNERIVEIAKMLSGEQPTTAAMDNAKELLAK